MRQRRAFWGIALAVAGFLHPAQASAYVFSTSGTGLPLRWPAPARPVFYANWGNDSGLGYSNVFESFTVPLQRWKYARSANIDFVYYQGANNPTELKCDSTSSIFFTSRSSSKLSSSVIGLTAVCSTVSEGRIVGTDVLFNDEDFTFTVDPTDTTQAGASTVYLQNVAAHEFGHAYGLGHSAVLQSAMVFLESPSQAKPSCDDIHGIAAAYPLTSFQSGRGSISGSIVTAGGTAVFGAHVLAISRTRGTVMGGALSGRTGTYVITDLEPGDYFLMVEPFQSRAPMAALCGGNPSGCSYSEVNADKICSSETRPFKRFFIEESPGRLARVSVQAGLSTPVGEKIADCAAMIQPWGPGVSGIGTGAPEVLSNVDGTNAVVGVRGLLDGGAGSAHYFRLTQVHGTIRASVFSYGLYGPLDTEVTILDQAGNPVEGVVEKPNMVSGSASGYVNYDASAVATLPEAAADYYVRVKMTSNLGPSALLVYPGGAATAQADPDSQVDQLPYYAAVISLNDSGTLLPSSSNPTVPDNARCELASSPPVYADQGPGNPGGEKTGSYTSTRSLLGCGALAAAGGSAGNGTGTGGPGAAAVFSTWGILLLLLLGRFGIVRPLSRRVVRLASKPVPR